MFKKITIQTHNKVDFIDITTAVQHAVTQKAVAEGICYVYCPHTTAGIVLNENWDADVERDMAMLLAQIVPDQAHYRHAEGNSSAHIKAVLLGSEHFVFVQGNQLQMGTWQGVFLAEFDGPRTRTVWVKVVGERVSAS